ncbi:MAG: hypothetical protein ACRCZ2_10095 [Fusobacteriaceae bacterium]
MDETIKAFSLAEVEVVISQLKVKVKNLELYKNTKNKILFADIKVQSKKPILNKQGEPIFDLVESGLYYDESGKEFKLMAKKQKYRLSTTTIKNNKQDFIYKIEPIKIRQDEASQYLESRKSFQIDNLTAYIQEFEGWTPQLRLINEDNLPSKTIKNYELQVFIL